MYFVALATDYDGTLAEDGLVAASTLTALDRLKESGRRLLLVTGRELPDLKKICPELDRFDLVVAENGALIYDPASGTETTLGPEPPPAFIEQLRRRNVTPLSVGRRIVATFEPNERIVLEVVRDLGLELQIIFNKGAVMVLPAGINKATGLAAALAQLKLSPLNVVGIGDAENDHAFLQSCGCAVAVANALPMLKKDAELVTAESRGAGVAELIERLLKDDLAEIAPYSRRQLVPLVKEPDGSTITMHPQISGLLIAGSSGGGKSTVATGLLERIGESEFQFCVIDPEGDYAGLQNTVTIGDPRTPPRIEEALALLDQPTQNVVIDLTGIDLPDRPRFLAELLPGLCELRVRTARPHWLVVDEAHHMLPPLLGSASATLPREFAGSILITVRPEHVCRPALESIAQTMTLGIEACAAMRSFLERTGEHAPAFDDAALERGEALLWQRDAGTVRRVCTLRPQAERLRHSRKYAEGELEENKSFYFKGADNALNLRAQNLNVFLQMAQGVDDRTWLHHLRAGDYSRWIGGSLNDKELAAEIAAVETDDALDQNESRLRIEEAIKRRYTGPA
ncbi:MAG: HAD hydrolase family protein [Alphaproteobacteria bacterium]|nr:HAD hydrolase family protein [Alphaproteobacteria bacterium]